jgi:hypothetical protein
MQLGGGFKEMSSPPAPGSDYQTTNGTSALFERFVCGATGCLTWFENLLQVKNVHVASLPSQPSIAGYVVSYNLPQGGHQEGCVGSMDPKCAGGTDVAVEIDHGWLEVYEEKMRTVVVTHKEVKLDNAVANGISQALLAYAELARELAEHACCLKAAES